MLPGKSVDPQTLFHNAACDIICSIMFGARYEYDHQFFQAMIRMMAESSKIANGPWGMVQKDLDMLLAHKFTNRFERIYMYLYNLFSLTQIYDTMPLLRSLPLPFQQALSDYKAVKLHVLGIIQKHRATRVPLQPRDVIDCYLDQMDKRVGCCRSGLMTKHHAHLKNHDVKKLGGQFYS